MLYSGRLDIGGDEMLQRMPSLIREIIFPDLRMRIYYYPLLALFMFWLPGADEPALAAPPQSKTTTANSAKRAPAPLSEEQFQILKDRAEAAREIGELDTAIETYRQILKGRPRWAEGWWSLGTLCYDKDRYAEARDAFRTLAPMTPRDGQVLALLGLCEYRLKEYPQAQIHLEKARVLGLGNNPEMGMVVILHQGILYNMVGQFEQALNLLKSFGLAHQEDPTVLEAMGCATLRVALPPENLPPELKEMVRQFGKAAFLEAEHKREESFALLRKLEAQYRGKPNVAYAFGVALLLQKENSQALQYFQQELERDPRHFAALLQLALQLIADGRFSESLDYARRASEIHPDQFVPFYAMGRCYLYLNDLARAIPVLEKAARLAPNSSNVQYTLAQAYQRAKRPLEAERASAEFRRLSAQGKKEEPTDQSPGNPANADPRPAGSQPQTP